MLPTNFLLLLTIHNAIVVSVLWMTGRAVLDRGVKVNYTRKINHGVLFFSPILLAKLFPFPATAFTFFISGVCFLAGLAVMTQPIRERFGLLRTAFAGFDRPEDRPHTLFWIATQTITGYAVLVLLYYVFERLDCVPLIVIPLLVAAIGDGLAEPIGVRFGRHPYRVPTLAHGRIYHRTWEGSACVFWTAIVMPFFFAHHMSFSQWMAVTITLPPVMTIVEAISPHSWDTPTLYLSGGLCIAAVMIL